MELDARGGPRVLRRDGITNVGISLAKLERHGWEQGAARIRDAGLRVTNLIGLGPFQLARPDAVGSSSATASVHALDAGESRRRRVPGRHHRPAGPLTWEDGRRRARRGARPGARRVARGTAIPFALEHTNSLRVDVGFVHTLRDAIDLARRLDVGVCMEINACWAERGLARHDRRRHRPDPARAGERLRGRHAVDAEPARPRRRRHPARAILGQVLDAGYAGCFDLELIGPAIEDEGYASAVPPAVDDLGRNSCSRLGA